MATRQASAPAYPASSGQTQSCEFPAPGDAHADAEHSPIRTSIGGQLEDYVLHLGRGAAAQPLDPAGIRNRKALRRGIVQETCEVGARRATDSGEVASDDNSPIRLQR